MSSLPSTLQFWLAWPYNGLIQATTIAAGSSRSNDCAMSKRQYFTSLHLSFRNTVRLLFLPWCSLSLGGGGGAEGL